MYDEEKAKRSFFKRKKKDKQEENQDIILKLHNQDKDYYPITISFNSTVEIAFTS